MKALRLWLRSRLLQYVVPYTTTSSVESMVLLMETSSRKMVASGGKTMETCIQTGMKKRPWTHEEDELLSSYIGREGEGRWRTLPKKVGLLRSGKSCRLRWINYLRPSVKRGHISPDEEDLILRLHRLLGNRWSLIAGRISGRTDNEIKNYWNTHLSKKLISQGIDPRTHKPLSSLSSYLNPNHNSIHLSSSVYRPQAISPNTHGSFSCPNSNNTINGAFPDFLVSLSNDLTNQYYSDKHEDKEDDILIYSPDEGFCSFLDSLINEEMCNEQTLTDPGSASKNQQELKNFNGNPAD